ncbi:MULTISPECIES: hypothetical protein [Methylorubrum]|uniref:hypothetical protein n=1 Tax=Methylorubrum TaxID=2282523 RepID=UPI0020A053A2|nr:MULTISPECIES: hypothetical protein [Methylorubrum]MCP1550198.1 hypothetical protein [Methylorubrum zatmanii]MCP1553188.1 hypothetical protein [Methylorubrum extorquens]MCP1580500.1 hypothetical protein [Methylorubrum extorquens]
MGGSSADIEALLIDVTDPDNPMPGMLPAIFRDIVGRLDAAGLPYAVAGRIALTLHEQARFVGDIEIVADLDPDRGDHAAELMRATRARFAAYMDPHQCRRPIVLTLRSCACAAEAGLLSEARTRPWFGVPARLASAEHLLWLWCHTEAPDHAVYASALIAGGTVDLHRVQSLLREADDVEESGQRRLRLAIGDAVLTTTSSFSRFMAERRTQLDTNWVPVRRSRAAEAADGDAP